MEAISSDIIKLRLTGKRLFFLFLFLYSICSFAQKKSVSEIDQMIFEQTQKLKKEAKYNDLILLNKKAKDLSENQDYEKGIAWSYYNIGNALCSVRENKKSIEFLDKSMKLAQNMDEPLLIIKLNLDYSRNYLLLKIKDRSLFYLNKAKDLLKEYPNGEEKTDLQVLLYQNYVTLYYNFNEIDEAKKYMDKVFKIKKTPYNSISLAFYHFDVTKNTDSALHYANISKELIGDFKSDKYSHEKVIYYNTLASFYQQEKKYDSAIDLSNKAIAVAKPTKDLDELARAYSRLSEIYKETNQQDLSNSYLNLYKKYVDSIDVKDSEALNLSVKKFINEKEEDIKSYRNKTILIVAIIVILFLTLLFFINKHLKSVKLDKDLQINKLTERPTISEEEKQIRLDKVIQLAKENNPEFLPQFKEIFPDFKGKLLNINPNLSAADLTFCAMLSFNFSTKDIAEYTFVSARAIQIRKNRLRKKLHIPSEKDIYLWMNELNS